jgi:hypothetical protein
MRSISTAELVTHEAAFPSAARTFYRSNDSDGAIEFFKRHRPTPIAILSVKDASTRSIKEAPFHDQRGRRKRQMGN